jgi:hypothetical protein
VFPIRSLTVTENDVALPAERGNLEYAGLALVYEGNRVKSALLGRDLNPLGRGDGTFYPAGAFMIHLASSGNVGFMSYLGTGNSMNNLQQEGTGKYGCSDLQAMGACSDCCCFFLPKVIVNPPKPNQCGVAGKMICPGFGCEDDACCPSQYWCCGIVGGCFKGLDDDCEGRCPQVQQKDGAGTGSAGGTGCGGCGGPARPPGGASRGGPQGMPGPQNRPGGSTGPAHPPPPSSDDEKAKCDKVVYKAKLTLQNICNNLSSMDCIKNFKMRCTMRKCLYRLCAGATSHWKIVGLPPNEYNPSGERFTTLINNDQSGKRWCELDVHCSYWNKYVDNEHEVGYFEYNFEASLFSEMMHCCSVAKDEDLIHSCVKECYPEYDSDQPTNVPDACSRVRGYRGGFMKPPKR